MTDHDDIRFHEIEWAVRGALAKTNLMWRNTGAPYIIACDVIAVLDRPAPTIEEVADWISMYGGVMQVGDHYQVGVKMVDAETVERARALLKTRSTDA